MFAESERDYIHSQRLLRVGTVSDDAQPDVVPVGFDFDGDHFFIGGRDNESTRKFENVASGSSQMALVLDDLVSLNPWRPRRIRIYGTADIVQHSGYAGKGSYLRVRPLEVWSWGLEK